MTFPTSEHVQAAQEAADLWKQKTGVYVWPSVTLAQADIESAGWTKLAGVNNGFGIKATKAQIEAGDGTYVWTQEVVNGQRVKVKAWFANFATLALAYSEHARIPATVKAYSAAWKATTPQAFIEAAGPHYATAPDYAETIIATIERLNLTQYDKPSAGPAPAPSKSSSIIAGAAGAGGVVIATVGQHLPSFGWEPLAALAVVALLAGAAFVASKQAPLPKVTPLNTAKPPATHTS